MRLLIIDDTTKEKLASLRTSAEECQLSFDDLLDIYNGHTTVPGDDERFVRHIPDGFKVVFTIEHQPKDRMRHISISVSSEDGKLPSIAAVELIMSELGFDMGPDEGLNNSHVYVENGTAINVMQKIKK